MEAQMDLPLPVIFYSDASKVYVLWILKLQISCYQRDPMYFLHPGHAEHHIAYIDNVLPIMFNHDVIFK